MKLAVFLVIFCCFSIIKAIDTDSLFITGNEKNKSLYIHNNSEFAVYLESYYYDRKADWILENIKELEDYGIEPLELFKSDWTGEKSTAMRLLLQDYSSITEFKFIVKNVTMENLPQLKFTYKTVEYDNDVTATVNLLPAKTEAIDIDALLYSESDPDENKSVFFETYNYNNDRIVEIDGNSLYLVVLEGELSEDRTLSSGKTWYLENEDEIKSNKSIEFISSASRSDFGNLQYIFIFKVNELSKNTFLPPISFAYKESEESTSAESDAVVNYIRKNEKPYFFHDKSKGSLYTKINDVVLVGLEGSLSSGNDWYLENEDEVRESDAIEIIKLNDDDKAPFVSLGSVPGSAGYHLFKFQIKETAPEGELKPTLKFIQTKNKSGGEILSTAELTLKIKEKPLDEILPVIVYKKNKNQEVYVESNTVLVIHESENSSTGYQWVHVNADEIEKSDVIDYLGYSYESNCRQDQYGRMPVGCGGSITFKYHIKEVTNEDQLPNIQLMLTRSLGRDDRYGHDIKLKLKSNTTECSFNGYKCCSNAKASVLYQDKDGDWSVENGDWCIIKKDDEEEEETPKLIRTCKSESLGYPCCKNQELIYTDSDSGWGYEDGNWCGIYSCVYTGNYPVCKHTKKVVYTDDVNWGVEDNEWCVICL